MRSLRHHRQPLLSTEPVSSCSSYSIHMYNQMGNIGSKIGEVIDFY
jgi:hypothetical protein